MNLRPVSGKDRALIENLFNLYRNDLSPYAGDFFDLDENGYFEYGAAEDVLPFGDGVETYIIEENARAVGLVMVTDESYALEGCSWRFQELYLVRAARGRGIARAACEELLRARPGRWCLSVYKTNLPARRFWDALIRDRGRLICTMPGEEGMTDMVFDTGEVRS